MSSNCLLRSPSEFRILSWSAKNSSFALVTSHLKWKSSIVASTFEIESTEAVIAVSSYCRRLISSSDKTRRSNILYQVLRNWCNPSQLRLSNNLHRPTNRDCFGNRPNLRNPPWIHLVHANWSTAEKVKDMIEDSIPIDLTWICTRNMIYRFR